MSELRVTAEGLTIHPHNNADALELAQVGLYRAVVPKGAYHTGEYAIYIPEQAILPAELIEELGLVGYLAGKQHNRVKAVRLRGELSQGIVCRPSLLSEGVDLAAAAAGNHNFAEALGITKWVPEVPADLSGEMIAAPDILPWIDIQNIKRYPDVFAEGEMVIATEKIHGSACVVTVVTDGPILVSSKGFSEKRLSIVESDRNLYWRAVRTFDIDTVGRRIAAEMGALRVAIYGEVYGVQDLKYGTTKGAPGYAAFDIRVELSDDDVFWLNRDQMLDAVGDDLELVPPIYRGPFVMDTILSLASGREHVTGTEAHIREGVVVRPLMERTSEVLGGERAILKVVSEDYLMRKGKVTEYE